MPLASHELAHAWLRAGSCDGQAGTCQGEGLAQEAAGAFAEFLLRVYRIANCSPATQASSSGCIYPDAQGERGHGHHAGWMSGRTGRGSPLRASVCPSVMRSPATWAPRPRAGEKLPLELGAECAAPEGGPARGRLGSLSKHRRWTWREPKPGTWAAPPPQSWQGRGQRLRSPDPWRRSLPLGGSSVLRAQVLLHHAGQPVLLNAVLHGPQHQAQPPVQGLQVQLVQHGRHLVPL